MLSCSLQPLNQAVPGPDLTHGRRRAAACRPIPLAPPPEPVVEALEDLSAADPSQLCQLSGSGQVVAFAQLR